MPALVTINALISLSTVIAAFFALFRPNVFSGSRSVSSGEWFYVKMYVVRAVPLGALAGVLPFFAQSNPWHIKAVLVAAALVQGVDVIMGAARREWGMIGGAAVAVVVHSLTAGLL